MDPRKEISSLEAMPHDILLKISECSTASLINLYRTCRSLSFFKNQFLGERYEQVFIELRQLLNHASLGRWTEAKAIWSKDPGFLTLRGTIYHPNRTYVEGQAPINIPADKNPGRYQYVNLTAWQIALVNEEYEIAAEMAKEMDQDEKEKQFAEIFPRGIAKYDWDFEEAKNRLEAVFDAVIKDTSIDSNNLEIMNDATRSALHELYRYVKPTPEHQAGLVFDANIYLKARTLYERKLDEFNKNKSLDQRSFWCVRVEEYLASLLGTGYLRQHVRGIFYNPNESGCTLANKSSYFAFHRPANSLPGFNFFVGIYGGADPVRLYRSDGYGLRDPSFGNLCEKKREQREKIYDNFRATMHRNG